MSEQTFWKPKPRPFDLRAASLFVPSIASSIGFFCFAVLALSFTEMESLGPELRKWLVIIGAFGLAGGGEIGTLAISVEVHRKERNGTSQKGDRSALAISKWATMAAFVIAFAMLLGTKARWGSLVQEWGVILLGVLAVLDAYSGFREFGYYLGEYDERLALWEQERDAEELRLRQKDERRDDRRASLALKLELDEMRGASGTQEEQAPAPIAQPEPEPAPEPVKVPLPERYDRLIEIYSSAPKMPQKQAGALVGVSRQQISADLAELVQVGRIRRNGHGVEVN